MVNLKSLNEIPVLLVIEKPGCAATPTRPTHTGHASLPTGWPVLPPPPPVLYPGPYRAGTALRQPPPVTFWNPGGGAGVCLGPSWPASGTPCCLAGWGLLTGLIPIAVTASGGQPSVHECMRDVCDMFVHVFCNSLVCCLWHECLRVCHSAWAAVRVDAMQNLRVTPGSSSAMTSDMD